ncbi:hypothetical protein M422DRAFT_247544 [Sphaerobolus stellatus SS14]|nr:hypothetical protein M422DRAFT_247544 [Sphaerobolus stellatus SS14]
MSLPSTLVIQSELKCPTLDTTTPRISDPRFRLTSTLSMVYIFGSCSSVTVPNDITPLYQRKPTFKTKFTDLFIMPLLPSICNPAFNTNGTQFSMHNREIQAGKARQNCFRKAGGKDRRAGRTNIQTSHLISQLVLFLTFRNPNPSVVTPITPRQGGSDYILLFVFPRIPENGIRYLHVVWF